MVYTYVGKGTVVLGARNKPVEKLQVGDIVLGYYIGIGPKRHTDSKVKSIRYVGKADCKLVGSLSEHALIPERQLTISSTFKYTSIDDTVYSVSRVVPRPFAVHKTIPNVDIYEIELIDSDVVPLLTSYMFIAFTEKPLNFIGGIDGKEKSKEQSNRSKGQFKEKVQKKEKGKTRKGRGKRKKRY